MNAKTAAKAVATPTEKHSTNDPAEDETAQAPRSTGEILDRSIDDQIRDRAYELYVQRGRQGGQELQDWLDAEFELLANR
ncbi:MAG TPA: DUF2934 domain-containing protein [Terriglobales bacterium]|nr:DUF2934 domain-containing protein [Terriglobales bacterium]